MTGCFATTNGTRGAFYGNGYQLAIQLYGVTCTVGWSLFMTFLILICINSSIGLRVSVTTEENGLDRSFHGEGLYAERSTAVTPSERVASLLKNYADAKAKTASDSGVKGVELQFIDHNQPGFREYCASDDSSLTSSDVIEEVLSAPLFPSRPADAENKKSGSEKLGGSILRKNSGHGNGGNGVGGCGGDDEAKPEGLNVSSKSHRSQNGKNGQNVINVPRRHNSNHFISTTE